MCDRPYQADINHNDNIMDSKNQRPLTHKERLVVEIFDSARPGLGAMAKNSILNNDKTGWADIIADTPEGKLVEGTGTRTWYLR